MMFFHNECCTCEHADNIKPIRLDLKYLLIRNKIEGGQFDEKQYFFTNSCLVFPTIKKTLVNKKAISSFETAF